MSQKNTKMVKAVKNQNNSNELFKQWNKKNQTNIKCSNVDCFNNAGNNAYIVVPTSNFNKKYIIPLCKECYEEEDNYNINTEAGFIDYGIVISVEQDLLLEYNS